MHFAFIFIIVISMTSGAFASPVALDIDPLSLLGVGLTATNHYGAPIAPWKAGAHPGWYFARNNPNNQSKATSIATLMCKILLQCPQKLVAQKVLAAATTTPPPVDTRGYEQTFSNLTCATQASDYLTYGLVGTIAASEDCQTMCNSVSGCNFVNAYYDVNGKDGNPQLTCSLFSSCHTSSDADNCGGQAEPDGSFDFITSSDGFCKDCA